MRCTVDGLTPSRSAMTRMPGRPGVARASRIRFSNAVRPTKTLPLAPGPRKPGADAFLNLEAIWIALPVRPVAGLAEVQEPGSSCGEAGGGGGLGSLTIDFEHASTARSHSRSGSRSPALAKPMMALAIASRGGSITPQLWRAWMASSSLARQHKYHHRPALSQRGHVVRQPTAPHAASTMCPAPCCPPPA